MLKSWFGGKKRQGKSPSKGLGTGKSVNDVRGGRPPRLRPEKPEDALDARIKARKAKNLKMADVKAALASAGDIARPDITAAIEMAKSLAGQEDLADQDKEAQKTAIHRALRLKGSAQVIDEALTHPAWRYVAMAVIRGLLEEGQPTDPKADNPAKQRK